MMYDSSDSRDGTQRIPSPHMNTSCHTYGVMSHSNSACDGHSNNTKNTHTTIATATSKMLPLTLIALMISHVTYMTASYHTRVAALSHSMCYRRM